MIYYPLTEQDGLSDNKITCFFQDSKGFMWIGTVSGLNRYDGSAFHVYKTNSKAATELADNTIHAITEDKHQHLWIATKNGLSDYDTRNGSFRTWRVNNADVNSNLLTDILIDKDGAIWAATFNGLLKFNRETHHFTSYLNNMVSGTLYGRTNRINKILIDSKNRFWLCAQNGLWRFYPTRGTFEQYIGRENMPTGEAFVNTIFEDRKGNFWLGLYADGLQLFDPETRTLKDELNLHGKLGYVHQITAVRDIRGNYFLNADTLQIDPDKKTSWSIYRPLSPAEAFSLQTVYASKDNLLWWGTDKGIRILDLTKQFFRHFTIAQAPFTAQGVSFLQSGDALYVGGSGSNFLKRYDTCFRLRKILLGNKKYSSLLNIVREDKNNLWLCTETGLILFNENTLAAREFHAVPGDTATPAMDFMTSLFIDSRGNHWVFPWRSGIWQLNTNTGRFKKMFTGFLTQNREAKKLLIMAAAEDASGNIWFADLDEGLIHYDTQRNAFSKPTENIFGSRYTLNNLFLDHDWLWCVITGKVFRIHTTTLKTEQWKIPDELDTDIYNFCQDKIGSIWITTRKGLLSFNKQSHQFKRYTTSDGLKDHTMTESLWLLQNGKIMYSGHTSFTVFDPQELSQPQNVPPVMLTAVYSQNKMLSVQQNNRNDKFIDLDYTYNNFTFTWAVQNYYNPLQNQYYYKLEGVDTDWKYAGNKGIIQYAGLSPGKYIFRMRGAGSNGILNEKGDYITIVIHPPFWKSWWFIGFCCLSILAAFFIVVRYISQRNLREKILKLEKEQAIEKERNRISRDMHDGLGSGLTKIAIMSEVAKKQMNEPEKAKQQLQHIAESSRELVDNLQDIIWVLNPQNDTLESLAAYIREYALKFFEPSGTQATFTYPEKFSAIRLSEEKRRNIFLVIKESFNNICKHAWCNEVWITIEYRDQMIALLIRDDGKGFDMDKTRKFGNGLLNMQHRINQVGGTYAISSMPGKGTAISIEIPV